MHVKVLAFGRNCERLITTVIIYLTETSTRITVEKPELIHAALRHDLLGTARTLVFGES